MVLVDYDRTHGRPEPDSSSCRKLFDFRVAVIRALEYLARMLLDGRQLERNCLGSPSKVMGLPIWSHPRASVPWSTMNCVSIGPGSIKTLASVVVKNGRLEAPSDNQANWCAASRSVCAATKLAFNCPSGQVITTNMPASHRTAAR